MHLAFGRLVGDSIPWGTLFINVSGSFFLGWFMTNLGQHSSEPAWLRADDLRLLVAVGFTGAFTTFSTFEHEANQLLDSGRWFATAAYAGGSLFIGLLAIRAGVALARK